MKKVMTFLAVLLLVGCATHRIPTSNGDMVYMSLLTNRELPKGEYSITTTSPTGVSTTTVIKVQGYKSAPDKDSIKAITDAIKSLAQAAEALVGK